MNNSFFNQFVPKQPKFFVLLKQQAEVLIECASMLSDYVCNTKAEERNAKYKQIKEVERKGDTITHKILDELESTFITPIDREDINALTGALDDVIDGINSAAKRIYIYNPSNLGDSAKQLTIEINNAAKYINDSIVELDHFRKEPTTLRNLCVELHDMENRADDIYELAIKKLFEEETNALELIKLKDVLQELEHTTDAAEHVGKILKSIVVKYV